MSPQSISSSSMTTTEVTSHIVEYKAAVALNNIGVTLLHRSCYNDALHVLQDAFSIMSLSLKNHVTRLSSSSSSSDVPKMTSAILSSSASSSCDSSTSASMMVHPMLRNASKPLARSTIQRPRQQSSSSSMRQPAVMILTFDRTSHSLLDLLQLASSSSSKRRRGGGSGCRCCCCCYAIRIDDDDGIDHNDDSMNFNDTLMEISIILTNIATVYRCYANAMKASSLSLSQLPRHKRREKLRGVMSSGLSFGRAARSILMSMVDAQMTRDDIKRRDLLHMLLLDHFIHLSSKSTTTTNKKEATIDGDNSDDNDHDHRCHNYRLELMTTYQKFLPNDNDDMDQQEKSIPIGGTSSSSCFYVFNELFYITGARVA